MESFLPIVCFLLLAFELSEGRSIRGLRNNNNYNRQPSYDNSDENYREMLAQSIPEDVTEASTLRFVGQLPVDAEERDFRKSIVPQRRDDKSPLAKRFVLQRPRGDNFRATGDNFEMTEERPRGGKRELSVLGGFPHGGRRTVGEDMLVKSREGYYVISGLPEDAFEGMPHAGRKRDLTDKDFAMVRPRSGKRNLVEKEFAMERPHAGKRNLMEKEFAMARPYAGKRDMMEKDFAMARPRGGKK